MARGRLQTGGTLPDSRLSPPTPAPPSSQGLFLPSLLPSHAANRPQMGVHALMKVLEPFLRDGMPMDMLADNEKWGIDLSAIVHSLLPQHAERILVHEDWSTWDAAFAQDCKRLSRHADGKPIWVRDGHRLEAKLSNAARSSRRVAAAASIAAAVSADASPAKKDLTGAVSARAIEAAVRA